MFQKNTTLYSAAWLIFTPQSIYFSRFSSYTKEILAVAENTQKYLDVNFLNLIDFYDFTTKLQC